MMLISEHKGAKFLQFRKVVNNGKMDFMLGFPDASWSSNYVQGVIDAANEMRILVEIVDVGSGPVNRFIHVTGFYNVGNVLKFTLHLLDELSLREPKNLRAEFRGQINPIPERFRKQ